MALVIADLNAGRPIATTGGVVEKLVSVTGDSAYTTGGTAVTAAQFGLSSILEISDAISGGKILHYDPVNAKIQTLVCGASTAAMAEVANASDQSAVIGRMRVTGAA